MTVPTIYRCDFPRPNDIIMAMSNVTPYVSPTLSSLGDKLRLIPYDQQAKQNYYWIELVADKSGIGGMKFLGEPMQPCTTTGHKVEAELKVGSLEVTSLMIKYTTDMRKVNPDVEGATDYPNIAGEIANDSLRQMEYWAYHGYYEMAILKEITGLQGLKDIGAPKSLVTPTPIAPNDYQSVCSYFIEGINEVRKGTTRFGYEFGRNQIDVHISSDIIDKLKCTTIGDSNNTTVYQQLLNSGLTGVRTIVESDVIENSVYFVNHSNVFAVHTAPYHLPRGRATEVEGLKDLYEILVGTISFGATSKPEYPSVVYGENVLDFTPALKEVSKKK